MECRHVNSSETPLGGRHLPFHTSAGSQQLSDFSGVGPFQDHDRTNTYIINHGLKVLPPNVKLCSRRPQQNLQFFQVSSEQRPREG